MNRMNRKTPTYNRSTAAGYFISMSRWCRDNGSYGFSDKTITFIYATQLQELEFATLDTPKQVQELSTKLSHIYHANLVMLWSNIITNNSILKKLQQSVRQSNTQLENG